MKYVINSIFLIVVFTFCYSNALGQQWTSKLYFYENSVLKDSLEFGIHPDATSGIDADLGETQRPPLPPFGIFDARFVGESLSLGSKKDIRFNSLDTKVYNFNIIRVSNNNVLTIKWGELPSGDFTLQDNFGGVLVNVDMNVVNEVEITSQLESFKMIVTPRLVFPVIINNQMPDAFIGLPYSFSVDLEDFEAHKSCTFSILNGPSWLKINNEGLIFGTPSTDALTGVIEFEYSATNFYGLSDTLKTSLQLNPGYNYNDVSVPLIADTSTVIIDYTDILLQNTISASVSENDYIKILSVEANELSVDTAEGGLDYFHLETSVQNPDFQFELKFTENYMIINNLTLDNIGIYIYESSFKNSKPGTKDLQKSNTANNWIKVDSEIDTENNEVRFNTQNSGYFSVVDMSQVVTDVDDHPQMPFGYTLEQNYPNPFNPETTIQFQLPVAEKVSLAIYNLKGQLIRILINENMPFGSYAFKWDGRDTQGVKVSSGIYVYLLKAGSFVKNRKMILIK